MSDDDPEVWFCRECRACRPLDGTAGSRCDAPPECPNHDEWGGDNCGYVVCGDCHAPLLDRHLSNSLGTGGEV